MRKRILRLALGAHPCAPIRRDPITSAWVLPAWSRGLEEYLPRLPQGRASVAERFLWARSLGARAKVGWSRRRRSRPSPSFGSEWQARPEGLGVLHAWTHASPPCPSKNQPLSRPLISFPAGATSCVSSTNVSPPSKSPTRIRRLTLLLEEYLADDLRLPQRDCRAAPRRRFRPRRAAWALLMRP